MSSSLFGKLVNIDIVDSTDLTLFGDLSDIALDKLTH